MPIALPTGNVKGLPPGNRLPSPRGHITIARLTVTVHVRQDGTAGSAAAIHNRAEGPAMITPIPRLPEPGSGEPSRADYLAARRIFSVLPRATLDELAPKLIERTYLIGHHLFRAGDPPSFVFIVKSGVVALTDVDERGSEGVVLTYPRDHVFGQVAVVLGVPHARTATAVVNTTVLLVPSDEFERLYDRCPELSKEVIRELSEMLRRAQQATLRAALSPVVSRVASVLLACSTEAAQPDATEIWVDPALSHRSLALLSGARRETISRVLGRLIRAKVIEQRGRRMVILLPEKLRQLAEG